MRASYVADSSAILALLNEENGAEIAERYVDQSVVSTVNFSEIVSKLVLAGADVILAANSIEATKVTCVDFSYNDALIAASLVSETKKYGLSFGDRACLALAIKHKLPVLTADKAWSKLKLGVKIIQIR